MLISEAAWKTARPGRHSEVADRKAWWRRRSTSCSQSFCVAAGVSDGTGRTRGAAAPDGAATSAVVNASETIASATSFFMLPPETDDSPRNAGSVVGVPAFAKSKRGGPEGPPRRCRRSGELRREAREVAQRGEPRERLALELADALSR